MSSAAAGTAELASQVTPACVDTGTFSAAAGTAGLAPVVTPGGVASPAHSVPDGLRDIDDFVEPGSFDFLRLLQVGDGLFVLNSTMTPT